LAALGKSEGVAAGFSDPVGIRVRGWKALETERHGEEKVSNE
jgi:hypothetical protein